jgi:transcriptional regulator with XRE-family HTH domain
MTTATRSDSVSVVLDLLSPGGLEAENRQRADVIDLFARPAGGVTGTSTQSPTGLSGQITASYPPGALFVDVQQPPDSPQRVLTTLRESSGLTMVELAQMFGVSRRTIYNWADGAEVSSRREHRLREVAEAIASYSAEPSEMRAALRSMSGGRSIIDVIGMGAPISLVAAHLAARVGRARPDSPSDLPEIRLLPAGIAEAAPVDWRRMLEQGALPPDEDEARNRAE